MSHCSWRMRLFAVVCLVVSLAPVGAGEPDAKRPAQIETIYAVKDAQTGQLRPMTAAEQKAAGLPDVLARESRDLPRQKKSDGTVLVSLEGGFHSVVLIKKNPDGSFAQTCVETQDAAKAFLATPQEETAHDR